MSFVYLLECRDGSLYCGAAKDLSKRVKAHSKGKGAKYTRSRLPVELVASCECSSWSDALKLEARVKKLNKRGKLPYLRGLALNKRKPV